MIRKMKRQSGGMFALIAIALVSIGPQRVQAQDIKIDTRPLTPGEISDYGMSNTTQIASGNPVVGLGQPVYLDLLIDKDLIDGGMVVTQVVWSIDSVSNEPDGAVTDSTASITDSPLPPEMPTYDSVDRATFDIVDRAMIKPDVRGTYQLSVDVYTTDGVLEADMIVVGSVFLGKDYTACTLCHASKQDGFNATHHATALQASINDADGHFQAFCIKCHSLGYDTTPGAVNGGFDDVAADLGWTFPETLGTNNWDDMPAALQKKSNVQCESCHGPAQEHFLAGGDTSKIGISLSAGTCGQCHDAPSHHVKNFEWGNSLHGKTEVDRTGGCRNCHTTAGFIDANDPGMNESGEMVPVTATFKEGITCAACHDPHAAGGQVHQLRDLQSVTLENGDVITEGGAGLVCMNCHKSRRNAAEHVLGSVSQYFGPHHGPQGDMLAGVNAAEYGQDMPSSRHLSVVEESCAQCHMQETPAGLPEYAAGKVGGHSFMLSYDDGTNAPIHLTETCTSCHGEIEDFDFGGEDYNLNGIVEGVQSEIEGLMHEIAMLLPPIGSPDIDPKGLKSEFNTQALKSGLYNYLFVEADGSLGVHNPKYAAAILRSSLAELKGGIDIDRDGLPDWWEILHFGDLTSQSGDDDFDGDGLTNLEEYNLGTNPTLTDSDGDGFSDLVEVQGGSNPLEITSVPTSDLLMLSAVEIGYLPQATGSVVQIQSIDSLNGGSWTNIGPAQTNSGNWVFQLDTMRGTTNRFYRAIEE